ncbi:MAG: lamin tail domain-containing protein [Bacteroidales bacterium]|nr:lamin tail domain-containing protein [Bacteroidales bacterium]MCF8458966.1 lamin tail domain-containing protein [Bacteroidales bacterium]
MKYLVLFGLLFLSGIADAQFQDDFSDGNFTQNPVWTGDTNEFIINGNNQLQLNGSIVDTSCLVTSNSISNENEWDIWLKMAFAPSVNNNLRIYLISDVEDLKGPVNGYYLLLGENGSDDSIDLFRQAGNNHTKIIDGIEGNCGASTNTIRLKVTRDVTGFWQVLSDITGGFNFSLEGEIFDNAFTSSNYFGLFCKYTVSNIDKFYFDDLYSGAIQVDTIAPFVENFSLPSDHEISIQFSEAIDQTSAETIGNYLLSGIGNPSSASFNTTIPQEILLEFPTSLISGNMYQLSINNLEDISGNSMADTILSFSWFEVSSNDVVINELMADPNPAVSLPEEEYIELYNRSGVDITMSGWVLEIGGIEKTIPTILLPVSGYLLLCATGAVGELEIYGSTIGVPAFQGLTNVGQSIKIKTDLGIVISEIAYSENWYQDVDKEDGGWSLERIDPNNDCGQMSNWKASVNSQGGSPGEQNSIYAPNPDNTPPFITQFYVSDSVTVFLEFSEEVDPVSATNQGFYQIAGSYNYPEISSLVEYNLVELVFAQAFTEENEVVLQVDGVEDFCNNTMSDTSLTFVFYQPRQWDVIINEIMADPTPTVKLPDIEYVELLNTSAYPINLDGWVFTAGTRKKLLKTATILPGELLILCPADMCMYFGGFIKCMDVLGTTDLTNDGTILSLRDKYDRVVSSIEYSLDWYHDSYKTEGGWSLERIDPTNFCEGAANWTASEHSSGGSPGDHNSVLADNPDYSPPEILRAYPISNNQVKLVFAELLDSLSLIDPENFRVDHGLGSPISVDPSEPLFQAVVIEFADTFDQNLLYLISINTVSDCAQNENFETLTTRFAVPQKIEPNDIVINEILFNPLADGVDYIELYNRSLKTFDMSGLMLANWDEYNQVPASHKNLSEEPFLLFPDEYLVLTSSKEKVLQQYWEADASAFIEPVISLPTFANESGRAILLNKSLVTIDDFDYHEDMQFDLLNSFEGVALERINFDLPTNDWNNWHSAAETVGFGTPGLPNSQFIEVSEMETRLQVDPELFSPDNDGHDDVLTISYSFDKPGYVGTITIFDAKGRTIRRIADQVLLSTSGQFTWDGLTSSGQKARIGIYVVYFEYFDLQGKVHKEKKTCVVAAKLQ